MGRPRGPLPPVRQPSPRTGPRGDAHGRAPARRSRARRAAVARSTIGHRRAISAGRAITVTSTGPRRRTASRRSAWRRAVAGVAPRAAQRGGARRARAARRSRIRPTWKGRPPPAVPLARRSRSGAATGSRPALVAVRDHGQRADRGAVAAQDAHALERRDVRGRRSARTAGSARATRSGGRRPPSRSPARPGCARAPARGGARRGSTPSTPVSDDRPRQPGGAQGLGDGIGTGGRVLPPRPQ